jgi:preprotein translocase subunit SecF
MLGVSKEDLMKQPKEERDSETDEAELQRIFLEQEAKREAKLAQKGIKEDE